LKKNTTHQQPGSYRTASQDAPARFPGRWAAERVAPILDHVVAHAAGAARL
jgi:hypothetical protein